jgi:DNA-binding CsgD family transcriptional regulator
LYLCLALLDAGRYEESVAAALDGVADGHLAGVDHSFGGYMDSLAAEGLIRLGRWSDAETVLARHIDVDGLPVGAIRLGRARALLAARRGDGDLARRCLQQAGAQPVDPFHRPFLDAASSEVHLILGDWDIAADAAQRGWENTPSGAQLWSARFTMHLANAAVEQILDARAAREPVDVEARVALLRECIAAAERDTVASEMAADVAAHLAHASAAITRLTGPDPDAWANAARRWETLSDPWQTAIARLREAEAAASTGETARASAALHEAHRIASELGAPSVLADIAAVSRRTRLSVDMPVPVALDDRSVDRLGLTPREAEVLALVAAGQTNSQIGAALYISAKTASVHVSHILRKLGVTSRVDAAAIAQRLGVA